MDTSIDTGDPWDIPAEEPDQPQVAGGISPLAEGTGLFARVRASSQRAEAADGAPEEDDLSEVEPEAFAPEPSVTSPAAADAPSAEVVEDPGLAYEAPPVPEPVPSELSAVTADDAVGSVESVLQELEAPPVFDLVPPPAPEPVTVYDPFRDDAETEPDTPVETEETPPMQPAHAEMEDPVEVDDYGLVEIEFGAPVTPEGSELPTGKATQHAGEGAISRPVLLTTDSVGSANIAPVDIVVAVESVHDASMVAAAVELALDGLRSRCSEVGAEAVVSVTTSVSAAGSAIVVTATGTAVNLL